MEEDQFDARAQANMEVALDRVCSRRPDSENHEVRKRVAEHILRSARKGETTLAALTAAGEALLTKRSERGRKSA
jgi:hypothetical protein